MTEFENIDPLKLIKITAQDTMPDFYKDNHRKATVVYHKDCIDGFTSAWAFNILVEKPKYPGGITYIPMAYGDGHGEIKIPELSDCDDLFILDFSFSKYELQFWSPFFREVVLLDHHKTALENLGPEVWPIESRPKNLEMILDMKRSGAGITWDYFADRDTLGPEIERSPLVNYVEDRDLWKFALPNSKEISAYIQQVPKTFQAWSELDWDLDNIPDETVSKGGLLRSQRDSIVKEICSHPRLIAISLPLTPTIFGQCINCSPQFASEVGNYLVTYYGQIGVTYFQDNTGTTRFSLRSNDDLPDVAEIAEAFGGGGHRNAAGFAMRDPNERPEMVLYSYNPRED